MGKMHVSQFYVDQGNFTSIIILCHYLVVGCVLSGIMYSEWMIIEKISPDRGTGPR